MKEFHVYILASARNGTIYVGVTSNLIQRVAQHKMGVADGFTKKYGCHMLVYYESPGDYESAVIREKQLKRWKRIWKLKLIEDLNPKWKDLYEDIL